MAVNETRSMNGDLREGISDGIVQKLTPDRGGVTDRASVTDRNLLLQEQYGVRLGDGGTGNNAAYRLTSLHG
jgi:hypothetical protein